MTATWWLGPPGRLQVLARAPARDYSRTADDAANAVELLDGRAVQRRPHALRIFPYQWVWLTMADWSTLAALRARAYGPGPYALLDAATLNQLTEEQSAGYAPGYRTAYGSVSTADSPVMAPLTQSARWSVGGTTDTVTTYTGSALAFTDNFTNIQVPAGLTSMRIDLADATTGDDLDLYSIADPAGVKQGSSETPGTSTESVTIASPAAGQWQIDVYAAAVAGSSASYVLTVTFSAPAPGTPTLTVPHQLWPYGYPTPAGAAWSWTSWLQSPDAATVTAVMVWRDAAGASLSETAAPAAALSGSWVPVTVAGTAPAGAVYVDLQLRTSAIGVTVYLGGGRLALGDESDTWWPGEGLPAVSITGMTETVPVYDRRSVQLTLTEVRR